MNGEEPIPNATEVAFTVRSYEAGIVNHVTLPTFNYMQEAAGISAARLGWGIRALQEEGLTWMFARLRVRVKHYVPWGGKRLHAICRRSNDALRATAAMVPFAGKGGETTSYKEE